jgi:serine/threonine-protein kinase
VYRATDTNLKRQVAIKVLPEAVAADAERLARFQREAEVLAALNHPNIAAIYGLERTPSTGSGQAGQTALVMELVEGPTLADRIAQGPIPVDEALASARQISEALDAAHEQGILDASPGWGTPRDHPGRALRPGDRAAARRAAAQLHRRAAAAGALQKKRAR